WTEVTCNPIVGCSKISAGCKNCYAMGMARRLQGMKKLAKYAGVIKNDGRVNWTGKINFDASALNKIAKLKKPSVIFMCSMADMFHPDVKWAWLDQIYDVMEANPQHIFQVLTKRAFEMQLYLIGRMNGKHPRPKHIWHGVSVESTAHFERINWVRNAKTHIAFVSFEPLLESVADVNLTDICWAIVGGESGHGARMMHQEWVDEIYRACQKSGTAFFFKQWGAFNAEGIKVGKKQAGRIWRGKTWDEMPNCN
ncbi:MAG: phage Gp37/Gp68 family protein, partial [Alphaproteobacteria bacterium]|nr:phage Gp37/Gp68 family protein [Alphaproteobacteria bacterium]